jgi:type I restriction enzyme, S subunit
MRNLPPNWDRGRIKWDAVTVAGATPSTEDDAFWLEGDDPTGMPFVAIGDMSRRERVSRTAKCLSSAGMATRNMPIGQAGTLLLAMYASVGELAFLDIEATWNQALLGITPNANEVDARFLRYVLLDMRDDLLREVRSNTQANLNAGQVGDIWFQKPPLVEQRAIADYLDRETARIDTLIEEQQRLIEMLRERRVATIVESIGEADPVRLRRLVDRERPMTYGILQCGEPVDEGIPYIGPSDIVGEGQSPRLADLRRTTPEIAERYQRSVLVPGDVVVSIGPAYGKVAVVGHELIGANLTQDTVRIATLPSAVDTRYLVWVLLSRTTADFWDTEIMGATFRRLNLGTLATTPIPLPALDQQRRIAAYLDEQTAKIDELMAVTERFIDLSRERRSALITAAVTGQLDVLGEVA